MFLTLLNKEIRVHLLTFRFNAALITTFILIVISVWVLGNDFIARRDLYNKLTETYSNEKDVVYTPAQFQPLLHKPPSALSVFALGEEKNLGNAVLFSRWEVPAKAENHLATNTLAASRMPYDLTTIFTFVISLFALLLTYNAFSGEREAGTLKLLCSYGVSKATIFGSKFIAGFTVIAVPFLTSFVAALLILNVIQGIGFSLDQWFAILLMIISGLVYGAIFIATGLTCSSIAKRSSTSLIISLLIWTMGVMIIPSAGNSLAKLLNPLLPPEEINKLKLDSESELKLKLEKYIEEKAPRTGQGTWPFGYIKDENTFMSDTFSQQAYFDNISYYRYQEELKQTRAANVWKMINKHQDMKRKQAEFARTLTAISPAQQLRWIFTQLSGTDYSSHENFLRNCRRYRQSVLNDFQQKDFFSSNVHGLIARHPAETFTVRENLVKYINALNRQFAAGKSFREVFALERRFEPLPEDFEPPFRYLKNRSDLEKALVPITILSLMLIMTFFIGFLIFSTYDVR